MAAGCCCCRTTRVTALDGPRPGRKERSRPRRPMSLSVQGSPSWMPDEGGWERRRGPADDVGGKESTGASVVMKASESGEREKGWDWTLRQRSKARELSGRREWPARQSLERRMCAEENEAEVVAPCRRRDREVAAWSAPGRPRPPRRRASRACAHPLGQSGDGPCPPRLPQWLAACASTERWTRVIGVRARESVRIVQARAEQPPVMKEEGRWAARGVWTNRQTRASCRTRRGQSGARCPP